MMKNKIDKLFFCEHLKDCKEHRSLIANFMTTKKKGMGLVTYIKNYALDEELNATSRTYLVRDVANGELVGYFSLKAGSITVNEKWKLFSAEFDSIPGIELANFAVNDAYREAHQEYEGIGKIIFYYFVQPRIKEVARMVGMKFLYIFALPEKELIRYYRTMDFIRLKKRKERQLHRRIKPRYDRRCIFMYQIIE